MKMYLFMGSFTKSREPLGTKIIKVITFYDEIMIVSMYYDQRQSLL